MSPRLPQFRRGDRVPLYIPLLLISASSASILSTDLVTPSLPHLPEYFGTDAATVQLTMSLNLAAFALAQLIHGPLSDRVGRRPVFIIAMLAFALTSVACAAAASIDDLIVARTFMGLAACAEAVLGYAIINDLYEEKDSVKVLSFYGMALALTPALGPIIGGYIHVWFGWQGNFVLLAAVALLVAILIWRFLPETLAAPDLRALAPDRLVGGYLMLLANRAFMGHALTAGLTMAGLFAFVTEGPFLFIGRMGVATEDYGLYYLVMIAAFFASSLLANRLVQRMGLDALLRTGLAVQAVAGLAFIGVYLADAVTPETLTLAVAGFAFGLGWIFATAPVRAFGAASGGRGQASALLGSVQMGGGAVGAQAVSLLHDGTALPFTAVFAGCALLAVATHLMAWSATRRSP